MQPNPSRAHGPWIIHHTDEIYRDPFIHVWRDAVTRPDGKPGQHVVVTMKPGVCVLPIDYDQNVYLTSEFHYAIGRISLEGVSGGIEPDEAPETTAVRELQEELGLVAGHWEYLTSVDPFTTIVGSPTRLFLATQLSQVARAPEGTEQIETVKLPLLTALEKVGTGEISHAPTCVAILMAFHRQTLGKNGNTLNTKSEKRVQ